MLKHITEAKYPFRVFDNSDYEKKYANRKFIKLYLLEPEFIDTGEIFQKIGITHHYNAEKRLDPVIGGDKLYNLLKQPVRVLASAYLPTKIALEKERYFHYKYPKKHIFTIYVDGVSVKFKGVSECRVLTSEQRLESIREIRALHEEYKHTWKKELQLNTCKGYWDENK